MSDPVEAAIQVGLDVLTSQGVAINPETMELVKKAANAFIEAVGGKAWRDAHAAGDAAADAIKSPDDAKKWQADR